MFHIRGSYLRFLLELGVRISVYWFKVNDEKDKINL